MGKSQECERVTAGVIPQQPAKRMPRKTQRAMTVYLGGCPKGGGPRCCPTISGVFLFTISICTLGRYYIPANKSDFKKRRVVKIQEWSGEPQSRSGISGLGDISFLKVKWDPRCLCPASWNYLLFCDHPAIVTKSEWTGSQQHPQN